MLSSPVNQAFCDHLLRELAKNFRVLGPVVGGDGSCRLREAHSWTEIQPGTLPRLPAKTLLTPDGEVVWRWGAGVYHPPQTPDRPLALVGLPACELFALEYLDQVFAEDDSYRARRSGLLRIGAPCRPGPACFCPPRERSPSCDLLIAGERAWCGSPVGEGLLADLAGSPPETGPPAVWTESPPPVHVPGPVGQLPPSGRFWDKAAEGCLSCGACSAVCPTCYCYDEIDRYLSGDGVERVRRWDNCFFRRHALVAGGHNFRPGRGDRLRFRMEHKWLGFAPLQGMSSCVGCGRCREVCPARIDIAHLAQCIFSGEVSHV